MEECIWINRDSAQISVETVDISNKIYAMMEILETVTDVAASVCRSSTITAEVVILGERTPVIGFLLQLKTLPLLLKTT